APEPMVLHDIPPSRTYFPSLFAEHGLSPTIGYRSASFEMVRSLVGNGLGYALLSTRPANSVTYDGHTVVSRPIAEPVTPSRLAVVTAGGTSLRPEVEALVRLFRLRFGPEPRAARRWPGPGGGRGSLPA